MRLTPGAVVGPFAIDVRFQHLGIHTERFARKYDEVRVLALFQRAKPVVEVQHLGPVDREGPQRCVLRHAAAQRDRAGAQEEARLGHRVVRVDGHGHPGLFEHGPVLLQQPGHFRLPAGAVYQRQRHRDLVLHQLVDDAITFRPVLDDEFEVELLRQPDRGQQVVGPVAVEVDRAFALQHLDERVQRDVPVRRRRLRVFLARLAIGGPLALVLAGLDELLALEGGELHARGWRHLAALEVEAFRAPTTAPGVSRIASIVLPRSLT